MMFFVEIPPLLVPLTAPSLWPAVVGLVGPLGVPVLLSVCERVVRVCSGRSLLIEVVLIGCEEVLSAISELAGLRELAAAGEVDRLSLSLCNIELGKEEFFGSFLKQTAHCQAKPLDGFRARGGLTHVM
jgi:hypothetical protein